MNESKSGDSSLHDWFSKSRSSDGKPGWVQLGGKYAGKPCAKQPGQTTKPKCGSSKMKRNLDKGEEEAAFRRKNREDPNPNRKGKAKNVATEEMNLDEKCWKGYTQKGMKKKGSKVVPNCVPVGESMTIDKDAHKVQQRREKMRTLMQRGVGGERDAAKKKLGKTAELPTLKKEEVLDERSLSKGEEKDREKYVKGMKKSAKDFKARYGDDYKSVMYATATKMAKEEKLNEIHASAHTPHEVPSKNLKKLVSKAVKRIDTDVDGDTDRNDKAKGELGEFIPGVGNKRLYSSTRTKTAQGNMKIKSVKEALGELDEGLGLQIARTIDKTKPPVGRPSKRRAVSTALKMREVIKSTEKNKDRKFSGKAAVEESAAWTRKAGKNKEGGLNEKGRKSYERENPGSDLKAPSKKVGNPRRKSFCARMSGMKKKLTSSKTANDPNSRINKSLRAWNC